ncbi:MAG: hypothetical protein WCG75_02780 [Armatimonadota bacterium]
MTALSIAIMLAGQQAPAMKSQDIIGKCLAKYAEANSGIGEFVMSQTAAGKKVSIKTDLQFERPSKLFIHQFSDTVEPNDWLVVSDGNQFGYDVPGSRKGGVRRRLFEGVISLPGPNGDRHVQMVHNIYLAAKRSLGDVPNPFLEFITQGSGESQSLRGYLARLKKIDPEPKEKEGADGNSVYSISGQMWFGDALKDADGKVTDQYESLGRYEMQISKSFELISMKTIENMAITDKANNLPTQINIVTTWTGKIQLNQKPADAIFKVQ